METPLVRFRLPDGQIVEVPPGGIIGRMWGAQVRLNDPRISEAHAMVSLRGRQLKLLALRGWIRSGKRPSSEVVLAAGVEIDLARDLSIVVEGVTLPAQILALSGLGSAPVELSASVYSIAVGSSGALVVSARYDADATAHVWSTPEGWYLRRGDAEPEPIEPGSTWTIAGREITASARGIAQAGVTPTVMRGRINAPLRIVATYETAHIHREGQAPLSLSGFPARIVSELVAFDGPTNWEVVARELWRRESDRRLMRQNWDRHLSSLRGKLRRAGIREDLVRSDGRGNIELVLLPDDVVEDRT